MAFRPPVDDRGWGDPGPDLGSGRAPTRSDCNPCAGPEHVLPITALQDLASLTETSVRRVCHSGRPPPEWQQRRYVVRRGIPIAGRSDDRDPFDMTDCCPTGNAV